MAIEILKDAQVKNAKAETGSKRYIADGGNLYLCVQKSGAKSWIYVWTKHGRRREHGLGGYPAISLQQARVKAKETRRQIGEGLDPIREKRKGDPKTFGECTDILIAKLEPEWTKPKHGASWRRMKAKTKALHKTPVADIQIDDLITVLQPVIDATPETGRRLRAMIERVLDLASAHQWRQGDNPARWRGNLEHRLTMPKNETKGHFAAMDYKVLPAFIKELQARDAMAGKALHFTILTAARTSETLEATWSEFDLEACEWTIPAPRMKKRKAHTVPLSDSAMAIIKPLYDLRWSQYVFAGQTAKKPLSNMAMSMLLRRMGVQKGEATTHGFRSTFKDWASDHTSFEDSVSEFALAHTIPDATKAAYRRLTALDKRVLLMQQWDNYCHGIEAPKVIKLHG